MPDIGNSPPPSTASARTTFPVWDRRRTPQGRWRSTLKIGSGGGGIRCRQVQVLPSALGAGEELLCSVRDCEGVYHLACGTNSIQAKKFRCPQHECFVCKQKFHWRCVRCSMVSHYKCAPWRDKLICFESQQGQALCWRHLTNWLLETKVG